ncbi:hypothetical protein apy_06230 [Aeropyrum pernix]|uniref:BFN domain-containing protein n=1 Tax=Aeropyrum pernix TaxID=56636 RepID=A0A401H957_AERPX|nr:bifunctional nuclease domain-containing protein [Aeropyrum pernix]GBF08898.1 hypothetical protein apy_06230 [Aeropyrum pernix]
MPVLPGEGLVKVVDVDAYIKRMSDPRSGFVFDVTVMELKLENGSKFVMSNIPIEIVEAVNVLKNNIDTPRRQSLFIFLMNSEVFKDAAVNAVKEVVIDEIDQNTGLYTATLVLEEDGFKLKLKMIPSHAVYLALIAGRPIYVLEKLVHESYSEEEY